VNIWAVIADAGSLNAFKVRGDSAHPPKFHIRCVLSPSLDQAGGFPWRWDRSSPTTFYPCGRERPSPDSLCVCRREWEGLWEATPSIRRLAEQARKFNGPPPPASRPRCDAASPTRYASLRTAPSGNTPVSRNRQSAMRSLRATATMPIRLKRLPPLPNRSRNHTLRALSG